MRSAANAKSPQRPASERKFIIGWTRVVRLMVATLPEDQRRPSIAPQARTLLVVEGKPFASPDSHHPITVKFLDCSESVPQKR